MAKIIIFVELKARIMTFNVFFLISSSLCKVEFTKNCIFVSVIN